MITENTNIYSDSRGYVSFFPQMRPEKKAITLSDNEKAIFEVLKAKKSLPLNVLKEESGLSNKAWDKGIKALTKHKLANVIKTDSDLIVELIS